MARDRIGRDVFLRGVPEGLKLLRRAAWQDDVYDLIAAYGVVQARTRPVVHIVPRRAVLTLDEAIVRLEKLIGVRLDWSRLEDFLPETADPAYRRSALASSFVASLELARLGRIELAQEETFGPLMIRTAQ